MLAFTITIVEFNTLEIFLLAALAIYFLIHLYFVLGVHLKLAKCHVAELPNSGSQPISVIICARNERENLEKYLPSIFEQEYPNFEVVVVNDRSWDGTADLLEELEKTYANLKVVHVKEGEKFIAGKKFAATMAIKAASYDWLVFTDADCEPASKNWLSGMQKPQDDNVAIVLGYSPYFKKRSLLNVLIRFETFFTAVNYLSFALKGMPYMGVGRNMAYQKALFFKSKGFAAHMHIPSGDDDLFVNANATPENTLIQIHKDTQVWSEPKASWLAYLRQKKRHVGAGGFYKAKHRFVLTVQVLVQFFFYVTIIILACFPHTHFIAVGVFVLSLIIRCFVYPRLLKRLNYGELRWWFPILDIILVVFLLFNFVLSLFVKKVTWK